MASKDEQGVATLASQALPSPNIRNVVDITRFNSLEKLLAVTAKVLRVFNPKVSETELRTKALHLLDQGTQQLEQSQEYEHLRSRQGKPPSKVIALKLFLHEDVIRCGGRFGQSQLPFQEKFPLLLPGDSHLAKLIVQDVHTKL